MAIETVAQHLVEVGRDVFADRPGMPNAVNWIAKHPERLEGTILPAFARVLMRLSSLVSGEDTPEEYLNIVKLKEAQVEPPTLSKIIQYFAADQLAFKEVLYETNDRMVKGETGEVSDGKFFTYHTWFESSDESGGESLVVASFFDIGELAIVSFLGSEVTENGIIGNALVEALVDLGPESPLYDPLVSPVRGNFVIGYDGFHKDLQSRVEDGYKS